MPSLRRGDPCARVVVHLPHAARHYAELDRERVYLVQVAVVCLVDLFFEFLSCHIFTLSF